MHQSKENDRDTSVRTLLDYANDGASIHAPMNGVVIVIFSLLGLALSLAVLAADTDRLAALGLY